MNDSTISTISGAYEPPEGRKERPFLTIVTLSLYGAKVKWAISVVFITNAQVRVCVIRCVARAYIVSKR